ncbi:MAG: hypothetical protein U9Q67_03545, partial [Patescibacteria group bacterium]|nr:hypothetical protein [Patescibacteria group bacterium]
MPNSSSDCVTHSHPTPLLRPDLLQVYDRDVSVRDLLISEMSRMLMFPGTPDALSPEAMALIEAA